MSATAAWCLAQTLNLKLILNPKPLKYSRRWPVAQLAPLLLGPEGTTVRLGVQRSLPAQNGASWGGGSGRGPLHTIIYIYICLCVCVYVCVCIGDYMYVCICMYI
jgi:hypothetical protein